MKFYVTTPAGIEDIAGEEIEKLGGKVVEVRENRGRIFFEGKEDLIPKVNFFSRCSERVILLLHKGRFDKLDDIYTEMKEIDYYLLEGKTFAIRSSRVGNHDFTSIDVSRYAGQAVIDSFLDRYGERLKVNLDEPEVIIRVDVINDEFLVGIDTTGDRALHKRWWRVYNHPAHLNCAIACAMLKLAKWKKGKNLVDPMCGSGTIPIEGALIEREVPAGKNRDFAYFRIIGKVIPAYKEEDIHLDIYGIEKFEKHLRGAIENAKSAGVDDTIQFAIGDATKLKGSYDCIVTNPPYGLRIGSKRLIGRLYEKFIPRIKDCMHDDSKAVIITTEIDLLKRIVGESKLSILHERTVRYGGLQAKIFVLAL